ncbi:MAG: hypothetical protein DMG30_01785 [Acidobacteria bacterium]|nr:MAG: hypothetical protein DMG30_01785 [Acidobacteriota bacterium]
MPGGQIYGGDIWIQGILGSYRRKHSAPPTPFRGGPIMELFSGRHAAAEFVKEVFEEDHVALRLLPLRHLHCHQGDNTPAIGRGLGMSLFIAMRPGTSGSSLYAVSIPPALPATK